MTTTRFLSILLLISAMASGLESRGWTDTQGRKIEAALIRADGETVILKLKDGREVPYPLTKLSKADGDYVKDNRAGLAGGTPEKRTQPASGKVTPNFDSPWPDQVKFSEDPEIVTVGEDAAKKRFVYESANYRYVCDVRLSQSVVKGFAVMFEATHQFCRSLPLGLIGGEKTDGKLQILLFENFDAYVDAGGPRGSAGVFITGKNVVLVPLTSLGVRPVSSGYMLDRDKSSKVLPHELTHQLTPESYFEKGAMGWFTEGLTEYIATTPTAMAPTTCGETRRTSSNTPPPTAPRTWVAARSARRSACPCSNPSCSRATNPSPNRPSSTTAAASSSRTISSTWMAKATRNA